MPDQPRNWPLTDHDRKEIVRRAQGLAIVGTPPTAANSIGAITLQNGATVTAHVVHAVDPVITDGVEVVVINRKNPPGQGLPALPGGFLDKGENAVQAAAREALEEAGVKPGNGELIGKRNMSRPFDIRTAYHDMPEYGIRQGDIFMVSTQAVLFRVPDLAQTTVQAGDDAEPGSARRARIVDLSPEKMGVPDHFDMIRAALSEYRGSSRKAAE